MIQITDQIRGYRRACDRERAIKMMIRSGYDYFVLFRDVQAEFALQYSHKTWSPGHVYINR